MSSDKKKSLKERVIEDIGKFSIGSMVRTVGKLANNYFAARLLGPELFGTWHGAKIAFKYANKLHLGTPYAMRREVSIERGKETETQSKQIEIENVVFSFHLFVAILATVVLFGVTFAVHFSPQMISGLRFISMMIFIYYIRSFYGTWFRTHNEYGILSRVVTLEGIANILIIPLIIFFSFHGFLFGQVFSLLLIAIYSYLKSSYKIHFQWDVKRLKSLLTIGIPILAVSFSGTAFKTVDRLLILKLLDVKELGFYTLSTLASTPLSLLLSASSSVLYQRFAEKYGETGRINSLRRYITMPIKNLSLVIPVFIGAVYIAFPILVKLMLPEYINGVLAAQIFIFGVSFRLMGGIGTNFFITINKQLLLLFFQGVGIIANLVLSYLMIFLGYGIAGVAFGTSMAYFIYFLILITVSLNYCQVRRLEILKFLGRILSPYIVMGIVAYLIANFINFSGASLYSQIGELFVREILFILVCVPFFYKVMRELKLWSLVKRVFVK